MPGEGNQRNVFELLREHLGSKETFRREDVEQLTDWKQQACGTYWSKQLRPLVVETLSSTTWRGVPPLLSMGEVPAARHPDASDIRGLQAHPVLCRPRVQFFMPLSNENHLRDALDALFFLESIEAQLRTIPPAELEKKFPHAAGEADSEYHKRLCGWISDHFGGYSIYHVNGRYRAMALSRRAEVLDGRTRYLVDETTAVTRFIFPCADENEARTVAFLFEHLFVAAIIEMVNGEDEIWMVESHFEPAPRLAGGQLMTARLSLQENGYDDVGLR